VSQRLRILHVLRAPVGGLFRHVRDLAATQRLAGHHVGLLACASANDGLTESRLDEISDRLDLGVHRISMNRAPGLGDIAGVVSTRRLADALDLDVIHGHGAKGGLYSRLAAASMRLTHRDPPRSFYTPHGGSLHYADKGLAGRAVLGVERVLGRLTDGVIFESRFARTRYERAVGGRLNHARVVHNGLLESDFGAHEPYPDAADFLFIGELRMLKGVDLLVKALARLDGGSRRRRLVIVGDGPDASQFETLAYNLGLRDQVRFAGAMPAAKAFRLGRVLVMPSRAESFPYVVLEAAAVGMPVIASDVGGIPEIVEGTDTQLVESGNVDALAGAMEESLASGIAALARAKRLKRNVYSRFTVDSMTMAIGDFYVGAPVGSLTRTITAPSAIRQSETG